MRVPSRAGPASAAPPASRRTKASPTTFEPVEATGRGRGTGCDLHDPQAGGVGLPAEVELVDRAAEHLGGIESALPDRATGALFADSGIGDTRVFAYQCLINVTGGEQSAKGRRSADSMTVS
ncbi:hypothetical protein [Nannocystis pusilla]|uniref:hypothetical protein n=1 Tax=Nannocystis pusilla TaxID=889268 RepID=UPI003DA6BABD